MSKVRVVIQSRLSSSRLPAKALLPICGIPAVVLCTLRASNSGLDVVVATSTDSTDDILVEVLKKHNLKFMRGSLEDVLSRYGAAAYDLSNDDVVVRLTADNMFPDGKFVEELTTSLMNKNFEYLGTSSPRDGQPYGLSAEAFTVKTLRDAVKDAKTFYERDCVTPWMKKNYCKELFRSRLITKNMSHLRCTLDTFDDYVRLNKVFKNVNDPINISFVDLCQKLASADEAPSGRVPFFIKNEKVHSAMTLGAAQLGMPYGRTNLNGAPDKTVAVSIVKHAIKNGITSIDTARAYADSEAIIGQALKLGLASQVEVITKLCVPKLDLNFSADACNHAVDASIFRSCRELQTESLFAVLLHDWQHRTVCNQAIWNRLLALKNDGVIQNIGASVYTISDAISALKDPDIKYIQIPFNILDWRWKNPDFISAVELRPDVIVHARSIFLQGILCAESSFWPVFKDVDSVECIKKIDMLVKNFGRMNRADLCIAYARSQAWITSLVVGIESLEHLNENVMLFQRPVLTKEECDIVETTFCDTSEKFLNPSNWEKHERHI